MDDMLANIQTKERSVNFNKRELDRLQMLLTKYKSIIFCKKTDGVSTKQKESAWSKIECEFNAVADTPRTVKQLKYKFENLKRTAKKGASRERQEMRRTGGGPLPPIPPSDCSDATDWLRTIIPSSIDGNISIYDDDVINQKPTIFPAKKLEKIIQEVVEDKTEESHLPKKPSVENIFIEVVEDCTTEEAQLQNKIPDIEKSVNEASAANEKWDFDASTPYSSLKRPMSSPLKSRAKKRRTAENHNTNIVRQLLREKKLSVMDNLQELELQRLKESIRHAQELHDQTLRHNEERHKLEMQKLELDIKMLKKSDELL